MKTERVWDYPRPPRVEPIGERIEIVLAGRTVADTTAAKRVLETTHPPVYYLPREAFTCGLVAGRRRASFCEWKGFADYWSLRVGDRIAADCAWSYPEPTPGFAIIRDHLAVYCAAMDACFVAGEQVTPQPGGFYGGWITGNLVGPFKGVPARPVGSIAGIWRYEPEQGDRGFRTAVMTKPARPPKLSHWSIRLAGECQRQPARVGRPREFQGEQPV